MEHIIQFGIGIDDEAIRKAVMEKSERVIIDELKNELRATIFECRYSRYGIGLNDYAKGIIRATVDAYKEEIIRETSKELATRLLKTKKAKELLEGTIGESIKGEYE